MRAALYMRVSTEAQTTENQLPALAKYAEINGWTIADQYIDQDESGRKTSRPAFDRMMHDAKVGKFDVVVVVRLDRLGRSAQHLLTVLDELKQVNVGFVSVTQGIDTTTSAGKLMYTMLAAIAEFESDIIGERTRAGLARIKASGTKLGPKFRADRDSVVKRRAEGQTQSNVAAALGISVRTVQRLESQAA